MCGRVHSAAGSGGIPRIVSRNRFLFYITRIVRRCVVACPDRFRSIVKLFGGRVGMGYCSLPGISVGGDWFSRISYPRIIILELPHISTDARGRALLPRISNSISPIKSVRFCPKTTVMENSVRVLSNVPATLSRSREERVVFALREHPKRIEPRHQPSG